MYCQFDFYMIVLQSLLTIDYFMSKKMSNKDNKNLNQISKTKRRLDGQSQILRHRVQQRVYVKKLQKWRTEDKIQKDQH